MRQGRRDALAAAAPVPTEVDRATSLTISIRRTRIQLEGAGLINELPFTVKEWANLEAGPDVIQGFRARSVDLANNAGVPPIQARAINYDAKSSRYRRCRSRSTSSPPCPAPASRR